MYNFKDNDFYSKSEILLKLKYGKLKKGTKKSNCPKK